MDTILSRVIINNRLTFQLVRGRHAFLGGSDLVALKERFLGGLGQRRVEFEAPLLLRFVVCKDMLPRI